MVQLGFIEVIKTDGLVNAESLRALTIGIIEDSGDDFKGKVILTKRIKYRIHLLDSDCSLSAKIEAV